MASAFYHCGTFKLLEGVSDSHSAVSRHYPNPHFQKPQRPQKTKPTFYLVFKHCISIILPSLL